MDMDHSLTVNDLSSKFKSKVELYNLLTREGDIYLPPKQDSTQKFLRDVMLENKLYVKCSSVNFIKVPQYRGLYVRDLLKFAASIVDIKMYLPDWEYNKEINREWLCNLINTLIKDEFQEYVRIKVEKRKMELIVNQNLGIRAKPEFINIFRKSQAVSTMRGKSHYLVRVPKLSKDKQYIEELEEIKQETDNRVQSLNEEIEVLRRKIGQLEDEQINSQDNLEKLSNLFKLGIIDSDGMPITNEM